MGAPRRAAGIVGILTVVYLSTWPVDIDPASWDPAAAPAPQGVFALNDELSSCAIFARMPGRGPDTVAFDAIGYLYTGLADGRIVRVSPDGTRITPLAAINGRATGIAFDVEGNLLVADESGGAVHRVEAKGSVFPLLNRVEGEPLMLVNDLAVGNDGTVYVTESSTKFTIEQLRLEILEHRPNGRVLAYDPVRRVTRVLLGERHFPNGVVVSRDQESLVFAETTAYRLSRYWLRGAKAGTVETLIDNLPGFPGDVSIAENGGYWLTLLAPRSSIVDALAQWPQIRTAMARLPSWLTPQPRPFPYLIALDENGRIVRTLQAASRDDLPSFSSVVENAGALYMGTPGIGARIDADAIYRSMLATPQ
jgi:sugar lactone lactonase YvrE